MKTLYLHIGTAKTATTSLQNFLYENQEILRGHGYDYPQMPFDYQRANPLRNGRFLIEPCGDDTGAENADAMFTRGMEIVGERLREYDAVLLSDESIWNMYAVRRPDLWKKLMEEAEKRGFCLKVIVYLRRQDLFAASLWNQRIKVKSNRISLMTFAEFCREGFPHMQLDYFRQLSEIAETVGKENVIVRRFERERMKNGSIYEDFFEAAGIAWTEEYRIAVYERNTGFYGDSVELKRIINGLDDFDRTEDRFLRRLLGESVLPERCGKETGMFSPEEAREFMEKYREGNRRVAREFLGRDEDLFSMDFTKVRKWTPDEEAMQEEILRFAGRVALEYRRGKKQNEEKIRRLEQKLGEQDKKLRQLEERLRRAEKRGRNPLRSFLRGK